MIVEREELVTALEQIRAGTTNEESIQQSSFVAFHNGSLYTYNEEVICKKRKIGGRAIPKEWDFAVPYGPFISTAVKIKALELDITPNDTQLTISCKGTKVNLATAPIELPLDGIKFPDQDDWNECPSEMTDAIAIVSACKDSTKGEFLTTCIHIHPEFIESVNKFQLIRYDIKTKVNKPILVRREAAEHLVTIHPQKLCQKGGWLFVKNSDGLVVGLKEHYDTFPDISEYLKPGPDQAKLPKSLSESSQLAEVFSSEDKDNNLLKIELLSKGKVLLTGEASYGKCIARKRMEYSGAYRVFFMSPGILRSILEKSLTCHLDNKKMVIKGSGWSYAAFLLKGAEKKEEESEKDGE